MADLYTNNPIRNASSLTTHNPTIAQGAGATYFGVLKRWTGSTWIKEPLKVYLGSWQSKPLKRWNGSEWKLIDTTGT